MEEEISVEEERDVEGSTQLCLQWTVVKDCVPGGGRQTYVWHISSVYTESVTNDVGFY